jgi:hypothetical protein
MCELTDQFVGRAAGEELLGRIAVAAPAAISIDLRFRRGFGGTDVSTLSRVSRRRSATNSCIAW